MDLAGLGRCHKRGPIKPARQMIHHRPLAIGGGIEFGKAKLSLRGNIQEADLRPWTVGCEREGGIGGTVKDGGLKLGHRLQMDRDGRGGKGWLTRQFPRPVHRRRNGAGQKVAKAAFTHQDL